MFAGMGSILLRLDENCAFLWQMQDFHKLWVWGGGSGGFSARQFPKIFF
jgi:hypothetical protein